MRSARALAAAVGALLCAALVLTCAPALAASWAVDRDASRIGFVTAWEGEAFESHFERWSAALVFSPGTAPAGRLEVHIDTGSLSSGMRMRDQGMRGPVWFDVPGFPAARFVAGSFRATADGGYLADGTLTLKRGQRPVRAPFRWTAAGDSARLTGEVVLDRRHFDIGEGEWLDDPAVAFEVRVRYDLRLRRAGD